MASTIQHWTGFPPETYRQRLEEAFVRDCVTEAAIDDLFGLFLRAFKPGRIPTKIGENGTVHYSWNYSVTCPLPDVSFHPLEPYLAEFARNIYSPQVPDEAQYVVKKYFDDVMEYAEKMFEGDMEEDESEEEYGHDSEGESEDADDIDAQVTAASTGDNDSDGQPHGTASEGTYGDISNWSFSAADSRFQKMMR